MNQSELEAHVTLTLTQARENERGKMRATKSRLVLVLNLID